MFIRIFCVTALSLSLHANETFHQFLQLPVELQRTVASHLFKLHDFNTIDEQIATFSNLQRTCKHMKAACDIDNQLCQEVIKDNEIQKKVAKVCLSDVFDTKYILDHISSNKLVDPPQFSRAADILSDCSATDMKTYAAFKELQKMAIRTQSKIIKERIQLISQEAFQCKVPQVTVDTCAHLHGEIDFLFTCYKYKNRIGHPEVKLFSSETEWRLVKTIEQDNIWAPFVAMHTNQGALFHAGGRHPSGYCYCAVEGQFQNEELPAMWSIYGAHILPNDKTLLLTSTYNDEIRLYRLLSNGTIDASFNTVTLPALNEMYLKATFEHDSPSNLLFAVKGSSILVSSDKDYCINYRLDLEGNLLHNSTKNIATTDSSNLP